MLDDKNTNSGFVITTKKPPFSIYAKTVREIVYLDDTEKLLKKLNAVFKGYKNRRGLIGATASIAWNAEHDKTYEIIVYREKNKWGTTRFVDERSTIQMDKKIKTTFDNYDHRNKHNRLVPSSPCPVLFGIRGEKVEDLINAKEMIVSEKNDSWMVFETNQGTDDHLQKLKIGKIGPYKSVIIEGFLSKKPVTIHGGHVIFTIKDKTGSVDCATYEPTKEFREIIRGLDIGDFVEVYGGVREKPLTVNVEKIKVKGLEKIFEKVENPVCPVCKKHMKSRGKNQGFKCVKCGSKSDNPVIVEKKRSIKVGFYEAPVCARRHLSKPLKRVF